MAKRLVKVAKELNVGTASIVEYLTKEGFSIENKPTAKISEEMENSLLREFSKSMAIKEKADQLVIGTRPSGRKEEAEHTESPIPTPVQEPVVAKTTVPEPPAPETPPVAPAEPKEEPVAKEEEVPTPPAPVEPKEEEGRPKVQLKIKGKIDLDAAKKPKAKAPVEKKEEAPSKKEAPKEEPVAKKKTAPAEPKEKAAPPKEEAAKEPTAKKEPAKPETPKEEKTVEAKAEPPKEKTPEQANAPEKAAGDEPKAPAGSESIRAKTPELRGLKILGKIDIDTRTKKKKKTTTDKKDDKKGQGASGSNNKSDNKSTGVTKKEGEAGRRRRTRRRVPASSGPGRSNSGPGGGNNRRGDNRGRNNNNRGRGRDEVREVSQKEIDEKIKATMARISGKGSKKKRQKLRRDNRERLRERQEQREQATQNDKLQVTEFISVQDLANLMDVSVTEVITVCMNLGVIVSINQRLDAEIIELVASEFEHEVEFISAEEQVEEEDEIVDDPEDLSPRAPIVTVMGHVDHGKTSLLDYIRNANVADGEAGGITQHIGAYEVNVGEDSKRITFLDTPGHEAFTAMRARGAKVTDVAIIIIAADDRIMPQTKEAISHAQAAGVPMVFAINKVDKDGAQPERIKQELASMNLLVEEWGGDYQSQDISAKTGLGIDELLEKILLVAELQELQANPDRRAIGTILEASLDKGRGYVTKALVQTGTLEIGDPIVAGEHSGKVKAMFNERGKRIKIAGPSTPVLVLGLSGAPQAGERFKEMESEPEARGIANKRAQIAREQANRAAKRISLDEIGRRLALGSFKELNLIVKGDVDGSVEALSDSLIKLSQESVQVNVIHKAVGQIIESDILLASASDAIIIGFQVRPSVGARKLAEQEGVQVKTYSIIYEAIEEIKLAIEGMLEPTKEEKITANVEVREVYKISKVGTVAGCQVTDGKITRNSNVRLIRDGIVVYPTREGVAGELSSLRRFKDDVKEVKNGMECGLTIKNYNDIKAGDVVEAYEIIEIKQRLEI
ncbi:MAG: translation initiation factor IF-2 [Bacteroidota bacterium]